MPTAIRLIIRQPGAGPDALKLVASGRIDLGVLDIHDLAIAREQGSTSSASPRWWAARSRLWSPAADVRRPRDLEGRTVGVSGLPSDPAFLDAIVRDDGGDPRRVRQVTIGFNSVSAILSGKVAAAPVFWNAEGVALRRHGASGRTSSASTTTARPAYPEVVLVTARRTLQRERDRIRRTLLALRDGLAVVRRDPGAAVTQIAPRGRDERPRPDRRPAGRGQPDLRAGPAPGPPRCSSAGPPSTRGSASCAAGPTWRARSTSRCWADRPMARSHSRGTGYR